MIFGGETEHKHGKTNLNIDLKFVEYKKDFVTPTTHSTYCIPIDTTDDLLFIFLYYPNLKY